MVGNNEQIKLFLTTIFRTIISTGNISIANRSYSCFNDGFLFFFIQKFLKAFLNFSAVFEFSTAS